MAEGSNKTLNLFFQLDIVAFANLAQIYFIEKDLQYSLQEFMQENCANLVGHVNRMKERYIFVSLHCLPNIFA